MYRSLLSVMAGLTLGLSVATADEPKPLKVGTNSVLIGFTSNMAPGNDLIRIQGAAFQQGNRAGLGRAIDHQGPHHAAS